MKKKWKPVAEYKAVITNRVGMTKAKAFYEEMGDKRRMRVVPDNNDIGSVSVSIISKQKT